MRHAEVVHAFSRVASTQTAPACSHTALSTEHTLMFGKGNTVIADSYANI
jgi:hypothetical protein